MKKIYSLKNKTFLKIWGVYHFGILLVFGLLLLLGKRSITIDADLFNMLPKPVASEAISAADEKLTEVTGQNVFILVSNPSFDECKKVADNVYSQLKDSSKFKRITLYQDISSASSLQKLIEKYKFHLLDENTVNQINEDPEAFQMQILEQISTGFLSGSVTDEDPFMLSNSVLMNYLEKAKNSGTQMTFKDGVMTSCIKYLSPASLLDSVNQNIPQDELKNLSSQELKQKYGALILKDCENRIQERNYIMIQGVLSTEGAALASKENAVVQIHNVCDPLEDGETYFVYSGTPFHSYKSSSNASNEITFISIISLSVVLIILLLIFKSARPIIYSLLSIGVSILIAVCATFLLFKKIHILTLVFGTSLIGSCIDYSLHFFINWKGNSDLSSGDQIRTFMLKGLFLSVLSTVVCYLVLLFAPFNLIKQMAVFSTTGLVSSFLTSISVYPYIPLPKSDRHLRISNIMRTPSWYNPKFVGRIVITCLFVVSIGTILIFWFIDEKTQKAKIADFKAKNPDYEYSETLQDKFIRKLHISNSLSRLYKMEGEDLENEIEAGKVLQYSPSGWFIISGSTPEEVLQREELVANRLRDFNAGKERGGFMCTSIFVPSIKTQKKSYDAVGKLLPYAQEQVEYLGFDSSSKFVKDYKNQKNDYFDVRDIFEKTYDSSNENDKMMAMLQSLLGNYWLGQLPDGKYYSVILPVSVTNQPMYKQIAKDVSNQICEENNLEKTEENENVFFILKVADMNKELDNLTFTVLVSLIVVFVILFILLKFFYSWKQTFKITSVPILIVLMIVAFFYAFDVPIEFFGVTGMILVFGLGLDYIIYMIENEKKQEDSENARLEPFAIVLSFVTTAVSFGALALSHFVPVHLIGLSIFIGLSTAFCSTFFYQRAEL